MTFRIVSCGWNCAPFLEWTLQSVEEQSIADWEIFIIDDASDDPLQAQKIRDWCKPRTFAGDKRWRFRINDLNLGTPRNQYYGILLMNPAPEDIIVFLDLDGDRLAHPDVLKNLLEYYSDGTLVTYGSYRPVPDLGTSTPARAFPPDVVRDRTYRQAILGGYTGFNHLRTMKGKIFHAIPESNFQWPDGAWYKHGTDYAFMAAALELANGRYKCIEEVLLIYNHANPNADYLTKGQDSHRCVVDYLHRPALKPLEGL
jgi:glycosyltransferase involved in cell wall biosynthesis